MRSSCLATNINMSVLKQYPNFLADEQSRPINYGWIKLNQRRLLAAQTW